jgi:hypothetical protein
MLTALIRDENVKPHLSSALPIELRQGWIERVGERMGRAMVKTQCPVLSCLAHQSSLAKQRRLSVIAQLRAAALAKAEHLER